MHSVLEGFRHRRFEVSRSLLISCSPTEAYPSLHHIFGMTTTSTPHHLFTSTTVHRHCQSQDIINSSRTKNLYFRTKNPPLHLFKVSSDFATHPITLLLEILGGRIWASPQSP